MCNYIFIFFISVFYVICFLVTTKLNIKKKDVREDVMKEVIREYRETPEDVPISTLKVEPLSLKYKVSSENDKQFKLISREALTFKKGDVVCLTGSSETGKSTFMKIVVEQLRTSGLDEVGDETSANANDIIRYIVDMCNKERKRITFISTHQTCVQEMFSHELKFQKVGNESYIHEKR